MKVVGMKEAKASLSGYCEHAQEERVLITRHGKPVALMIGVEGQDLEDVLTASNPDFWRLASEQASGGINDCPVGAARIRLGAGACQLDSGLETLLEQGQDGVL